MKRVFRRAIYAIAALTTMACTENPVQETLSDGSGEKIRISVGASMSSEDTRVVIGELDAETKRYPMLWQENNEHLYIAERIDKASDYNDYLSNMEYGLSEDRKHAQFTFDLDRKEGSSFEYLAVTAWSSTPSFDFDNEYVDLSVPSSQTPTETSVDPDAMYLFAKSGVYDRQPDNLDFSFRHVLAYAKMTVRGLKLMEDEHISEVGLYVPNRDIAGRYLYHYNSPEESAVDWSWNSVSLDVKHLAYGDNGMDVWFSTLPVDDIKEFEVHVETDAGTIFHKQITVPEGRDFGLERGVVSRFTVDMTGCDIWWQDFDTECVLYYTTTDGKPIEPNMEYWNDNTFVGNMREDDNTFVMRFSKPVTEIGREAFAECSSLSSIYLPGDNLVFIGDGCFEYCTGLETVVGRDAYIGVGAFVNCTNLRSVEFLGGATLSAGAFAYCSNLEHAKFEYARFGEPGVFERCSKLNIEIGYVEYIPEHTFEGIERLVITGGVDIMEGVFVGKVEISGMYGIRNGGFYGCSIDELFLFDDVDVIESGAFADCSISRLIFLGNVGYMDAYAFAGSEIYSMDFEKDIAAVDNFAFHGCRNLANIASKYSPDGKAFVVSGKLIFCAPENLYGYEIPYGVTEIGEMAFSECELRDVMIPASVRAIHDDAFYGCTDMEYVVLEGLEPPIITALSFEGLSRARFMVPEEALERYREAEYWRDFADRIFPQ